MAASVRKIATYEHFDLLRTVVSIFGLSTQTTNDSAATAMGDLLE